MKKQIAVFTLSKNEIDFLPAWTRHHSKLVDQSDIYILDHVSSDESVTKTLDSFPNVNVESVDFDTTDREFRGSWLSLVSNKQKQLLEQYEYVLFAETDEFVFPDKYVHAGWDSYLKTFKSKAKDGLYLRCKCIEVEHDYTRGEPSLDFNDSGNWLKNRNRCLAWWPEYRNRYGWSKPVLHCSPVDWVSGFHDIADIDGNIINGIVHDDELLAVHCHDIDINQAERRHIHRVKNSATLLVRLRNEVGGALRNELNVKLTRCVPIPQNFKNQF